MSNKWRTALTLDKRSATFSTFHKDVNEVYVLFEKACSFNSDELSIDTECLRIVLEQYESAFDEKLKNVDILTKEGVLDQKSLLFKYDNPKHSQKSAFTKALVRNDMKDFGKLFATKFPQSYAIQVDPKICIYTHDGEEKRASVEVLYDTKVENYLLEILVTYVNHPKVTKLKRFLSLYGMSVNKFFDHSNLSSSVVYPHNEAFVYIEIEDASITLVMKNHEIIIKKKIINFGSALYIKGYMDAFKFDYQKSAKLFTLNRFYNSHTSSKDTSLDPLSPLFNKQNVNTINISINKHILQTIRSVLDEWQDNFFEVATIFWTGDLRFLPDFENEIKTSLPSVEHIIFSYNKETMSANFYALIGLADLMQLNNAKQEETFTLPLSLYSTNGKYSSKFRQKYAVA